MSQTTSEAVVELVRETLALPAGEVITPDQLLFYDLDFTSMDLLDFLFRIEERFDLVIPEGTLYRLARGEVDDALFCEGSVLTALGRERLMALLHDTPGPLFPDAIHAQTLPRYCTVAAFVRLIDHELARKEHANDTASPPRGDRPVEEGPR